MDLAGIYFHLKRYCDRRDGFNFTRGRPYEKDDDAHIEQKNWTQVMGVLGVVDVVSCSFPGSSREVLEYSGLPNGASRLRADLPTPGCLRVGP